MNTLSRAVLLIASLFGAQAALAHDPEEHEKEAAAAKAGPHCSSMKTMDHAKMDMKDPVMEAMMAKCAEKPMPADGMKGMKIDAPKASDDHGGR